MKDTGGSANLAFRRSSFRPYWSRKIIASIFIAASMQLPFCAQFGIRAVSDAS
jgi:hypothetical protein